jgi:hypothetical protein
MLLGRTGLLDWWWFRGSGGARHGVGNDARATATTSTVVGCAASRDSRK